MTSETSKTTELNLKSSTNSGNDIKANDDSSKSVLSASNLFAPEIEHSIKSSNENQTTHYKIDNVSFLY